MRYAALLLFLAAIAVGQDANKENEAKAKAALAEALAKKAAEEKAKAKAAADQAKKDAEAKAAAAEKKKAAPPPPPPPPAEIVHEVKLRSGTVLVGKLEPMQWRVRTEFGTLTIPVKQIKRVLFGRHSDPDLTKNIGLWIDSLAAKDPALRAKSRKNLEKNIAYAIVDLRKAAKRHDDPEIRRVAAELVDEADVEAEQIVMDDDQVMTSAFNLVGRIELETFKVTIGELGGVLIKRADIETLRARGAAADFKKVKVSGQHVWSSQNWVDTKIRFSKGEKVKIKAGGQIHFPNWGNQVFTPDGNGRFGHINGMMMGTLVGRFGKSGKMFRVGSSFEGKANANGNLQFCVMINIRGQPTNGDYEVRVTKQPG